MIYIWRHWVITGLKEVRDGDAVAETIPPPATASSPPPAFPLLAGLPNTSRLIFHVSSRRQYTVSIPD